jgi:hypothetical protein
MACKFIEIGPGQNFFISGYQKLMQWSVSQKEVTKVYGDITAGYVWSMVQTRDKKFLFFSDHDSGMKQIDVK